MICPAFSAEQLLVLAHSQEAAMPVVAGRKSKTESFAGALRPFVGWPTVKDFWLCCAGYHSASQPRTFGVCVCKQGSSLWLCTFTCTTEVTKSHARVTIQEDNTSMFLYNSVQTHVHRVGRIMYKNYNGCLMLILEGWWYTVFVHSLRQPSHVHHKSLAWKHTNTRMSGQWFSLSL